MELRGGYNEQRDNENLGTPKECHHFMRGETLGGEENEGFRRAGEWGQGGAGG